MHKSFLSAPWKVFNKLEEWWVYPWARILFAFNGIAWRKYWRFHGLPIIQKSRPSTMRFGHTINLRSSLRSNPLGPNHPVILCTWQVGAIIEVGDHFAMTGGTICAAERITIGNRVVIGANCTVIDTDFHPIDSEFRHTHPQQGRVAPVVIEDDVFVGMNCLILKGVVLGKGCTIGAGSIVTKSIPAGKVAAGNPASVIE